jgi:2-dehydropantoate 2-reductase
MKIAIIGAGAMGCMLGACLMEGGADVSLIVRRKELAEKYRSSGIRIKSYAADGYADLDFGPVPMKAVDNVEGMEIQDAVLFIVKGPDTKTALEQTMPIIGDQTKVITLQNGVGNTDILGEVIPKERIYYGCLNMSAIMEAPGVLTGALLGDKNVCLGSMVNGEEQKDFGEQICGILRAGGIGAVYMENVDSEVWYKLLLNLIANAPCGIVRLRGGEAFKNSEFHDMAVDIVREAIEVAAKLGVELDMDHLIGHVAPNAVKTSGLHYPSMAQDMMMKKAQTEIDFLNGAIERLGKQVGVPTPVNTTISRLVRTIESNYDRQYFPGGA